MYKPRIPVLNFYKKLYEHILEFMVNMGSSSLQDKAIQKPKARSKQLETAMMAPINKDELKKRIRNG